MLTGNYRLAAAILIGMFCGFLLVKSDLAWRKTCLNMFLLRDGRLLKTLLFSLGSGVTAVYFLQQAGILALQVRPGYFWASLTGGIISGIGLAFCCRVPMTAIAALGAGRLYALWSLIGMLLGVYFVGIISARLSSSIYSWSKPLGDPQHTGSFLDTGNPALWVVVISLVLLVFLHFVFSGEEEE
ncbi:MAG: YeeE/YedE thiosulfate transporter family protein [Victivallaceae bacterium]|nr:YeeE/YedE thiosulfate transporter family protein [Victivallaceae bacterium]